MYSGFVYRWTNSLNGKKYIGSHIGDENDGYVGSGCIFRKAVKKYGIEAFTREILEYVSDRDEVRLREQFHLDRMSAWSDPNYYNVRQFVDGGFEHINSDPEKIAAATERCRWMTHLSPKMRGKRHSEKTKQRQREASRDWMLKNVARAVFQFDPNGNIIATFPSIQEAARTVGGSPSNIKYTCEGKFGSAYGFYWSFTADLPLDRQPIRARKRRTSQAINEITDRDSPRISKPDSRPEDGRDSEA